MRARLALTRFTLTSHGLAVVLCQLKRSLLLCQSQLKFMLLLQLCRHLQLASFELIRHGLHLFLLLFDRFLLLLHGFLHFSPLLLLSCELHLILVDERLLLVRIRRIACLQH